MQTHSANRTEVVALAPLSVVVKVAIRAMAAIADQFLATHAVLAMFAERRRRKPQRKMRKLEKLCCRRRKILVAHFDLEGGEELVMRRGL